MEPLLQMSMSQMNKQADWIRPEIIFLVTAVLVGMACLILTPPFQVADEPSHFFRIVQIAQGGIIGERRGADSGGMIPAALLAMEDYFYDGNPVSGEGKWDPSKWAGIKPYLTERADLSDREFRDFRTSILYAPVVYLPQVTGVWLAGILKLPPLWMLYAGRLLALAVFVCLVYIAIRLTPICPWGFTVLALLPAVMFQAASLSGDSMTMAVLFLFTALALHYAFTPTVVTRKDLILLIALGVMIGLCKSVYILSLGLLFMIPPAKLGGQKRYWTFCLGSVGLALLAAALWSVLMGKAYVRLFDDIDEWAQIAFILQEPLVFINMLLGRILRSVHYLYLGGGLGLLNEFVGLLGWYAVCVYVGQTSFAVLFWCAIAEKNDKVVIREWHRWCVAGILAGTVLLVAAANYIIWMPPGSPALALFGRYFHPIAPMAFLLFHNRSFRIQCEDKWRVFIPVYFAGMALATVYVIAKIY